MSKHVKKARESLAKIIEREDAREEAMDKLEAEAAIPPVVFSVAPIHQHCTCGHTIRANGFCVHGNNL